MKKSELRQIIREELLKEGKEIPFEQLPTDIKSAIRTSGLYKYVDTVWDTFGGITITFLSPKYGDVLRADKSMIQTISKIPKIRYIDISAIGV